MHIIEILVISVALAMDAFAVALATGLRIKCTLNQVLRMSLAFGFFQFAMPVIGWWLGYSVHHYIAEYDHWIAFLLLSFVGVKMLWEAVDQKEEENCQDPTKGWTLLLLAIATSIDALAVGISIAVLDVNIWQPAIIIGIVCFLMTAIGIRIGKMIVTTATGSKLSRNANILGGLVLIAIGIKIVYEHIM